MSSVFPVEADQPTATALLGPGLFGWVLHLMCYGMILRDVFDYTKSTSYREDARRMKCLMWTVFALETVQIGYNICQLFHFVTTQRRDASSLLSGTIIDVIAPLPVGVIAWLVQGYLLSRAAKLFRRKEVKWIYLGLMGLPLTLALLGSVWTCIAAYEYVYYDVGAVGGLSYNAALAMWQWSSAFVDVVVSLTLAVLLRSRIAGFSEQTDTILRSLIALGLRTGAYTSLLAVAGAVTATAFPGLSDMTTNIPEAFWVPLSGLYTLSLMATLSSRNNLRNGLNSSRSGSFQRKEVQVDVDVAISTDVRGIHSHSRDEDDFGKVRARTFIPMDDIARGPRGFEEPPAAEGRHFVSFAEDVTSKEAMV